MTCPCGRKCPGDYCQDCGYAVDDEIPELVRDGLALLGWAALIFLAALCGYMLLVAYS